MSSKAVLFFLGVKFNVQEKEGCTRISLGKFGEFRKYRDIFSGNWFLVIDQVFVTFQVELNFD